MAICNTVTPESIRVVWWDYAVVNEQIFTPDDYWRVASLLKPEGGGGTRVSCVSEYLKQKEIEAEAVVVFTDGYVESDISWDISTPTLWVVTENKNFTGLPGHAAVSWDNV